MKKQNIIFIFFILGIFFGLASNVQAACTGASPIWTATPDYASVNSCVSQSVNGDTINVSAGNVTWSNTLLISKEIILRGAGRGLTIITDETAEVDGNNNLVPVIKLISNARITGFEFISPISGNTPIIFVTASNGSQPITTSPNAFRVDNCYFNSTTGNKVHGLEVEPSAYGLIDHCEFYDAAVHHVGMSQVTGTEAGRQLWAKPLVLGTKEALYVENCIFTRSKSNANAIDSRNGSKWVMRYSTMKDFYLEAHSGFFSGLRGTRSWEIYKNEFIGTLGTVWLASLRSGTGVVWGNRSSGKYGWNGIAGHHFSIDDSRAGQGHSHDKDGNVIYTGVGIWAQSKGNMWCLENNPPIVSGGSEYYDTKDGDSTNGGYPCRDQIGRSGGNTISSPQDLYPAMEWDNLLDNSTDVDLKVNAAFNYLNGDEHIFDASIHSNAIKINRDFYNDVVTGNEEDGFVYAPTGFSYKPLAYPHPFITDCGTYPLTCDQNSVCITKGDFDCNTNLNALDISAMVNLILKANLTSEEIAKGDMSGDNKIDSQDLNALINEVLK